MNNNFKKAFSFVEISMVFLIIGILIAGISKGIDMIYDMRLATARSLTDKAPMFGMENLEMWLETTSKSSFATGTTSFVNVENPADNQAIGRWNDLNSATVNSSYKNNAIQATSNYQPLYIKDGIKGLPALYFDGLDDYFYANAGKTNFDEFTIFIVFFSQSKSTTSSNFSNLINISCRGLVYSCQYISSSSSYSAPFAGGNPTVWIWIDNLITNLNYGQTKINSNNLPESIKNTVSLINNFVRIAKINFNDEIITLTVNPKQVNSIGSFPLVKGNSYLDFRIGTQKGNGELTNNRNYKGYLGEIILFGRSLDDQETKLIENYLSEKWGIVL